MQPGGECPGASLELQVIQRELAKSSPFHEPDLIITDKNKHVIHEANGEGNGNPLQYSCLENPMDRDWRAAVCGVTQSGHD